MPIKSHPQLGSFIIREYPEKRLSKKYCTGDSISLDDQEICSSSSSGFYNLLSNNDLSKVYGNDENVISPFNSNGMPEEVCDDVGNISSGTSIDYDYLNQPEQLGSITLSEKDNGAFSTIYFPEAVIQSETLQGDENLMEYLSEDITDESSEVTPCGSQNPMNSNFINCTFQTNELQQGASNDKVKSCADILEETIDCDKLMYTRPEEFRSGGKITLNTNNRNANVQRNTSFNFNQLTNQFRSLQVEETPFSQVHLSFANSTRKLPSTTYDYKLDVNTKEDVVHNTTCVLPCDSVEVEYFSEDVQELVQHDNGTIIKPKRQRTSKPQASDREPEKMISLLQERAPYVFSHPHKIVHHYLINLLCHKASFDLDLVRWEDFNNLQFYVSGPKVVARVWANLKKNKCDDWENFARGIRDSRRRGFFSDTKTKRKKVFRLSEQAVFDFFGPGQPKFYTNCFEIDSFN